MYDKDFKVKLIDSKNSFIFLSERDSRHVDHDHMIRVSYGLNKRAFFSLGTAMSSLREGELAMCSHTAKELGITRNESVAVSTTPFVASVKRLSVLTRSQDDYEILELLAETVQHTLLTQVRIIYDEQKLVIWITNTTRVTVDVDGVKPLSPGKLEMLTEVAILPPRDKERHTFLRDSHQSMDEEANKSIFDAYGHARGVFRLHPVDAISTLVHPDKRNFLAQPFTVFVSEKSFRLLRCGYAKNVDIHDNFGVVLGDLNVIPMPADYRDILDERHETPDVVTVRICVVAVADEQMPVLYAPQAIFDCFHAKIGAKMFVEAHPSAGNPFTPQSIDIVTTSKFFSSADELVRRFLSQACMDGNKIVVNSNLTMQAACECRFQLRFNPANSRYLVLDADLLRSVKLKLHDEELIDLKPDLAGRNDTGGDAIMDCGNFQQIIDDICRRLQWSTTSVLLTGQMGSGKTTLLNKLQQQLGKEPNYVYSEHVSCRSIKGKNIDSLLKHLHAVFLRLIYFQPSILILDDLETVCERVPDGEQPTQENLYFKRISMLLAEQLRQLLERNQISLIASCDAVSSLNQSVYCARGIHLFRAILEIGELNKNDRISVLKHCFQLHKASYEQVDFDALGRQTESFVMQDLRDIADKILFESYKDSPGESQIGIEQKHCEIAQSHSSMLALRQVHLQSQGDRDFSGIGGLEEVKKVLTETILWPAKYPNIFANAPLKLQSGVLLYGPPGTGKTLLARAAAKQCNLRMIAVKGPELLSKYIGASEQAVRDVFQKAHAARPCILFFDEFDSLAPRRGHDNTGVTDRVVNQFLTQLDGVESLTGVCVLCATSRPDLLDPALLRPGRIGKQLFCPMPDRKSRLEILQSLSKHLPLCPGVHLQALADATEGFSGADLQALLYNAQLSSVEQLLGGATRTLNGCEGKNDDDQAKKAIDAVEINQTHLDKALKGTRPSLSRQERLKYERIYSQFEGRSDVLGGVKQKVTLA